MAYKMQQNSPGDIPRFAEYPAKYTKEVVDFILFFHNDDRSEATKFMDSIIREGQDKGVQVKGYLYDDLDFEEGTEMENANAITSVGVQTWFFITDNFVNDDTMQLYKDDHLMKSIISSSQRKSIVPIWTKSKEDYIEIPYGMAAFTGLYTSDGAVLRKVLRMFDHPRHKAAKQQLMDKQHDGKMKWKEVETARRAKRRQLEEQQQQRKLENIDTDIKKEHTKNRAQDPPLMKMLETRMELIMKQLENLNLQQRDHGQPDQQSPTRRHSHPKDDRESEIPEHLLESLDSLRSQDSQQGHSTIYHITINQPANVTIANASSPTNDNVVKMLRVNDGVEPQLDLRSSSPIATETGCPGRNLYASGNSSSDDSFEEVGSRIVPTNPPPGDHVDDPHSEPHWPRPPSNT